MKIITIFCFFFILGCGQESAHRTPEDVSLGFFTAIYIDKDIKKAQLYVNEPMKEVIAHYHIASSVQRHFLNLSMTNVTLEVEVVDIDFFRKFTDDVNVIVKIYGLKGGRTWIDDRTIKLHRNNKKWKIVEILPEGVNRN
ncbi:hypothetical protein HQQ94_10355 [Shewanella sp. VB17]|uniref:DUF4878 domain-containing protein n=1 Tax=Shewanella sp. VB17 TaxID=2739432 RepID=UPI001566D413|nr:DUF4878 domain-containing protein [Shewanella sp. VB17]NRD73644.1 hypothetical protein [Shewanella sp. VB17]